MQHQSSPARLIRLSKGLWALVDAADYLFLSMYKWHAQELPYGFYAARTVRYGNSNSTSSVWMHREIMGLPRGHVPEVDHVNMDGLDNRRCNLRRATASQNACNHGVRSNNSSGYKGVSFRRDRSKWTAHVKLEGHRQCLGVFTNPEDAARAYDAAAIRLHGEFARLNFPPSHGIGFDGMNNPPSV